MDSRRAISQAIRGAINDNDLDSIYLLVTRNPEQLNNNDWIFGCHLHYACKKGHIDSIKLLIELGFSVNTEDDEDGAKPIASACSHGRFEVVRLLLNHQSHLDVSTPNRNPIFRTACSLLPRDLSYRKSSGYQTTEEADDALLKCVELLIEAGIDLTASYTWRSIVDMDASAFAEMHGTYILN